VRRWRRRQWQRRTAGAKTGGDGASNGSLSDEEFVSAGALVLTKSVESYTAEEITSMSDIAFDFSKGTNS
jgi:hypothetical protein